MAKGKREESPRGKRNIELHADCVHNHGGKCWREEKKIKIKNTECLKNQVTTDVRFGT